MVPLLMYRSEISGSEAGCSGVEDFPRPLEKGWQMQSPGERSGNLRSAAAFTPANQGGAFVASAGWLN
jgi:hypothetical protein